jgi:SAM-dependent methyltransferase
MDADAWDERYLATESLWGVEPNRFVRQQCERLPVGEALDLACGEGRNALWLAQLGWRVTGLDFSEVAIERAQTLTATQPELLQLRLAWRVQDVTAFVPKPASVDLVLVTYVHIPGPELNTMLSRGATALRPGGHLLVVGHDRRNLAEGVSGPQDIQLLYDPEGIRQLLADDCGLAVEIARTVERPTDAGIALDTLVRARKP